MHGAANVHPQTVGHAGAAVAGTGVPTIVGRPRVVTWKKTTCEGADKCLKLLKTEVLHTQYPSASKTWLVVTFNVPLEFDRFLTKMTQNGCCGRRWLL